MAAPAHSKGRFAAASELATGVLDALVAAGEVPPQHHLLGRFIGAELPADADYLIVDSHPPLWPPALFPVLERQKPLLRVRREGVTLLRIYANPAKGP
jgi:hypothetical protein